MNTNGKEQTTSSQGRGRTERKQPTVGRKNRQQQISPPPPIHRRTNNPHNSHASNILTKCNNNKEEKTMKAVESKKHCHHHQQHKSHHRNKDIGATRTVPPKVPPAVVERDKGPRTVAIKTPSKHHQEVIPPAPLNNGSDGCQKSPKAARHHHHGRKTTSATTKKQTASKPDPSTSLRRRTRAGSNKSIEETVSSTASTTRKATSKVHSTAATCTSTERTSSQQALTTIPMSSPPTATSNSTKAKQTRVVKHDDGSSMALSRSCSLEQDHQTAVSFFLLIKFLLATVIILSVVWVCLFTILATHTDINRKKIYLALESKYFPEKEGALIFTYLVVGYLWLGAVTYASLYCHCGKNDARFFLPHPTLWMVDTIRLPTILFSKSKYLSLGSCRISRIELMAVALFLSIQIATFTSRVINRFETPWWPTERVWYEVSKTFGKILAFTMMILFFPIIKNCCFWWDLLNFQFERVLKFHRWLAWFLVWMTALHAITALVPLWMTGEFLHCMWPNEECQKPGGWANYKGLRTSQIYTYGWCAVMVMIPLVVTSLPWFRRHKFEWFYYTHFLFVPFLILLHLHFQYMIYYMAPGVSAYVLDKIIWFVVSRRRTKMVDMTIPAPGFVRVTIAIDPRQTTFLPGQWVQINIPAISFWEWHPMSVAEAPGHSTIAIDIKVMGDWTNKLYKYCQQGLFDPSKLAHSCIFLDSFHGSSHTEAQGYLHHNAIVMVSGGIGITPLLSALRTLVEQSTSRSLSHVQKCIFVWCVNNESVLDLYRHELARYQTFYSKLPSGCQLEIMVHCTNSMKSKVPEEEALQPEYFDLPLSHSASCPYGPRRQAKPEPFRQMFVGYGYHFGLTILAGCGALVGIFLANVAAYDSGWRNESESMLQLLLAVLFCIFSTSPLVLHLWMSTSNSLYSRTTSTAGDEDDDTQSPCTMVMGANEDQADQTFCELNVNFGCRPDISEILLAMKECCQDRNIPSVGVSVCGPDKLVDSVHRVSNMASSPSIAFVVDEETFDW